ncbi:MAG: ribosome biogenesis GTPase YlqF [Oscillospiraceae bacterium]|nr:ribosome biogenesis GTPase YlqF [Oscillospiraceae bacterium]
MDQAQLKSIQWFPGHMAKTRRAIKSNLPLVDAVVEIIDARVPVSSQNPEMSGMISGKPRMIVLNKCDMADDRATAKWIDYFRKSGVPAVAVDCKTGKGLKSFMPVLQKELLKELLAKRASKGMTGQPVRVMIVGIPNVGKSSFINKMSGSKKAKVEDRPGVTRVKQWVKIGDGAEMLDMPGVLWPKFDDQEAAQRLAFTGAIKDEIIDTETLSMLLLRYLADNYPAMLTARYKFEPDSEDTGKILLEKLGKKRGMLISGGEIDTERAAITVLDEFRAGKIGRITLEMPPHKQEEDINEDAGN